MDWGVLVSRVKAEHTALAETLERYVTEVTARKKHVSKEAPRVRALQTRVIALKTRSAVRSQDGRGWDVPNCHTRSFFVALYIQCARVSRLTRTFPECLINSSKYRRDRDHATQRHHSG